MNVRPTDMPALRDETAEMVLRTGPALYERAIRDGRQLMKPLASPARGGNILAGAEVRRLKEADLFYVSGDMTDLAIAAARTLPSFSIQPEDMPSPAGLMLFEKPIWTIDYGKYYPNEGESPIVAVSWSHWTGDNPHWTFGGIWTTWYSDCAAITDTALRLGLYDQAQADAVRRGAGRLLIDNELQTPFSNTPLPIVNDRGESVDFNDTTTNIIRWMAILKTAWLLMAQPVASTEDAAYDRAARRRLEKQGQEPPRVRVIKLRRASRPGSSQSDREYHHQWVVRGHWRQHWYPTRQVHRPIWIAPHIKGPEDAPLLGGEKVYAWTR